MAERPSSADESLGYGYAKGCKKAFEAFLAGRDPKGAQRRKAKSSAVRGQIGVLRQTPDELLAEEMLRRARRQKRREQTAARMRRYRQGLLRKKA